MEDPDILILDESMNGLDNLGVEDMRKFFLDLKEKGKTILLATTIRKILMFCVTAYTKWMAEILVLFVKFLFIGFFL